MMNFTQFDKTKTHENLEFALFVGDSFSAEQGKARLLLLRARNPENNDPWPAITYRDIAECVIITYDEDDKDRGADEDDDDFVIYPAELRHISYGHAWLTWAPSEMRVFIKDDEITAVVGIFIMSLENPFDFGIGDGFDTPIQCSLKRDSPDA